MSLRAITPLEAKKMMEQGAVLIDVRGPDEFAREQIPGADNKPLDQLASRSVGHHGVVLFHCRSGARTRANSDRLANAACREAYIVEGGIDAWKAAGLPVKLDRRQPIEIMRQVQIAAGSLVLAGALLGFFAHPNFHWLSGAVGAGLLFAGASGTCMMANLLRYAPWNRAAATA